jgi:HEPN domain-containing protein
MVTRKELQKLAKIRLSEAKTLYDKGFYDGSCYLAGYTMELALKARICKILDLIDYPDSGALGKTFKTHKFDTLIKLSGLENKFDTSKQSNQVLYDNWSLITDWSEEFRYKPVGTNLKIKAQEIINALEDPKDGVFTWIKKRW